MAVLERSETLKNVLGTQTQEFDGQKQANEDQRTGAIQGIVHGNAKTAPRQHSEALVDAHPVGHQLFLCRDLKSPLSDQVWARFIMINEGKLPKEMAAWETWDRFTISFQTS